MKNKSTDEITQPIALNNHLDWLSFKAEARRNNKNISLNMESLQEKAFNQSVIALGKNSIQFILSK